MDAKDHPVISVLGDQRRFVVPIYQRQYSWGDARLGPFWDDVVAKAEEVLEGKPKFSHYMGALILAPGGDGFTIGATPQFQVVDGQQRLTTFQLFLVALRDVGERLGVALLGSGPINGIPTERTSWFTRLSNRRRRVSGEFWLSDRQWRRLEPLLPNKPRGVLRVDDRRVVSGIVHVPRSGGRWVDAPAACGPRETLYNRFVRWAAKGVWRAVFDALAAAGGPPAEVPLDSTRVKAHRRAVGGKGGGARRRSASAAAGAPPSSTP